MNGQSFAKNAGLYGERVGALHLVSPTKEAGERVRSQMSVLQRSEISSPPSYGARVVSVIGDSARWVGTEKAMWKTGCADSEPPGTVRGVEEGHQDDGGADNRDAEGAVPAADGEAEDAGAVGAHIATDWDVQVSTGRDRNGGG